MAVPVLIAGKWREAKSSGTFRAENPTTREQLPEEYPISTWADCDAALDAATAAFNSLPKPDLPIPLASFLETYAAAIESRADDLATVAHTETGLPVSPRLKDVELPRTVNQLRLAAAEARTGSWALPTIDTKLNIRSCYAPIGPVWVFGPNNFPYAYNGIAGGDFAAAIATGNPVIAKANTSHPGTSRLLAEIAHQAAEKAGIPTGWVQMIYRTSHDDGMRLVADPRTAALGYTGSRAAGLALKAAADAAGKPTYLELSSINPVVVMPGALAERQQKIAEEFTASCLMGAGQFCTNPGLVFLVNGPQTKPFIDDVAARFKSAPVGTLLSGRVEDSLKKSVEGLKKAGAELIAGGAAGGGTGHSYGNTLLRVSARHFMEDAEALQAEAFGNSSLFVVAENLDELLSALDRLEGNLTGSVYIDSKGADDRAGYPEVAQRIRQRVGRFLNNKMPTGVAVSPAMNHGGPYPATGHSGFTAVGFPGSMRRFAMLQCFDNVPEHHLPKLLQNPNPTGGKTWRLVDNQWSTADVA